MTNNSIYRVLDANANRASEGLRVLEDIARFILDHKDLSARLKQLRHDIRQAIPAQAQLRRDTEADVGTSTSTEQEMQRSSLCDLISANAKRAQEALRVLEEHAKLSALNAAVFEQARYQAYIAETDLLTQIPATRLLQEKLYVLIDHDLCTSPVDLAKELVDAGAGIIQYRAKSLNEAEYSEQAKQLRDVIDKRSLFIVNDHIAVAEQIAADGVHVGQDDESPSIARERLGPLAIIGLSTHTPEQVKAAHQESIDYIGIGPMFSTNTKPHEPVRGPELLQQAAEFISLPSYAIGGINVERINELKPQLPHGVAVAGCVCSAKKPQKIMAELFKAINE